MSLAFLDWHGGALDGAVWQGIEFLEIEFLTAGGIVVGSVLEADDDIIQTTVTAHLSRPANGIQASDVTVSGGRRLADLEHQVDAIANGDTFFRVRFPVRGDHSDYRIELLTGGADPLHPFHSCEDFNFYVDCPAGDCRHGESLLEADLGRRPAIDLLAKDYRGYLRVLSEWIKVHNPHWADLAPASLERVLVEDLAHQADMLSYYQDRVANEAYIDTATQRYSLRQHGVLLDYRPYDGQAAATLLSVRVTNAGFAPAGLEVALQATGDEAPVVFWVRERTAVEPENNWDQLQLAAWPGAADARLAAGTTELFLLGHGYRLAAGQRLALVEGALSQVVTLDAVAEERSPGWVSDPAQAPHAADVDVTRLSWVEPLAHDLHPWQGEGLRLFSNLVDCVQGGESFAWLNPQGDVPRQDVVIEPDRRNSIVVARPVAGAVVHQLRALRVPDGPVLFSLEDGDPAPWLEVVVDGDLWLPVESLHDSRSSDNHYVATADGDGHLWLQFGDGVQGREIEVAADTSLPAFEIEIRARTGFPLLGNCAPETLTRVLEPRSATVAADLNALGAVEVTNVVAGSGGLPAQALDALRQAIPASLKHGRKRRAVALEDYAAVARDADPRVARAAAKALGGPFNTVLVLVDPEGQVELSDSLRETVEAYLDDLRMAGREVVVVAPEYVELEVELALCVEPGFLAHEVRDRVLEELRPGAAERPGYFHPDRLTFGEDVELGDLLAFVQDIPGVRSVTAVTFRRRESPDPAPVVDRIELGAIEVARLDADEDFPENGVLRLRVAGIDDLSAAQFSIGVAPSSGGGP